MSIKLIVEKKGQKKENWLNFRPRDDDLNRFKILKSLNAKKSVPDVFSMILNYYLDSNIGLKQSIDAVYLKMQEIEKLKEDLQND